LKAASIFCLGKCKFINGREEQHLKSKMNFRDTIHRLSQKSSFQLNIIPRVTVIIAGALFLLAGFTITIFLLNFNQLQHLAEEAGDITPSAPFSSAEASAKDAVAAWSAAPTAAAESAEVADWLTPLNHYRAMTGLAAVSADAQLSRADFLHSHYLAVNYAPRLPNLRLGAEAHTEDPDKPGFSTEGAVAARASDVDWVWAPGTRPRPSWAIDNLMQAPFHRMQIINPYLTKVGYATDCQGSVCFAALNTGTDVDPPPAAQSPWPKPLVFPPDGAVIDSGAFSGEWPDPLSACPGYTSPAGLPITLELGNTIQPGVLDYSVRRDDVDSQPLEACAFDANTYVNSDPAAQSVARAILGRFGATIIVPRKPLSAGRYVVMLTAGKRYRWSFSIAGGDRE
jgi:cysteine-rich secretory family protein